MCDGMCGMYVVVVVVVAPCGSSEAHFYVVFVGWMGERSGGLCKIGNTPQKYHCKSLNGALFIPPSRETIQPQQTATTPPPERVGGLWVGWLWLRGTRVVVGGVERIVSRPRNHLVKSPIAHTTNTERVVSMYLCCKSV